MTLTDVVKTGICNGCDVEITENDGDIRVFTNIEIDQINGWIWGTVEIDDEGDTDRIGLSFDRIMEIEKIA